MTWEEAVKELRSNPTNKQTILDNYFEENIYASSERFYQSDEFNALKKLIPINTKNALDIGAGRGIVSFALAKHGLKVTALEPDLSNDIGSGAIKSIASKFNLPITVVESFGESLPFETNCFDLVYVRQVLHHASDLSQFCKEVFRVLKPGGIFIATREHVLSNESDLNAFLNNHTLHHLYGGEHAYTLPFYLDCMNNAGFSIRQVLHPYQSVINYAPVTEQEMKTNFAKRLAKFIGFSLAKTMMNNESVYQWMAKLKSGSDNTPGRLYSFVSFKPTN